MTGPCLMTGICSIWTLDMTSKLDMLAPSPRTGGRKKPLWSSSW